LKIEGVALNRNHYDRPIFFDFKHIVIGKPVPTFPRHALKPHKAISHFAS
jgi:hypothetical protein